MMSPIAPSRTIKIRLEGIAHLVCVGRTPWSARVPLDRFSRIAQQGRRPRTRGFCLKRTPGELTDLPASNMLDQLAAAAKIVVFEAHDFSRLEFRQEPVQVFIIGD
jgi:hypothetical protein